MSKMLVLLKLGVPAPSKVTWSRFVSPKKAVIEALFWRKSWFWLTSTKCWPPLNIHRWKAMDLSFLMVFLKKYFLDLLKRQIFCDALAQIFSLILRPCHMQFWMKKSWITGLYVFAFRSWPSSSDPWIHGQAFCKGRIPLLQAPIFVTDQLFWNHTEVPHSIVGTILSIHFCDSWYFWKFWISVHKKMECQKFSGFVGSPYPELFWI